MLGRVLALDRGRVRRRFEERFTATRMAKDYVAIYERLLGTRAKRLEEERAKPKLSVNGAGEAVH
jgi:hypothetical protein